MFCLELKTIERQSCKQDDDDDDDSSSNSSGSSVVLPSVFSAIKTNTEYTLTQSDSEEGETYTLKQ